MTNAIALTNAQKLELLNKYLIADGKTKVNMWKVARHQPILDAYVAAEQFEATEEELSAQTIRPVREFDLTENEFHAAMVLVVNDCLDGMGGSRPLDLDNDPYTWVYAETLVKFGWSKESAAGTFASLNEKGVIYADGEESTMSDAGYRWLDTKFDDAAEKLARTKKVTETPVAPVAKSATKKVEKTETVRQNGVRFPKEGGLCWMAWKMFDEMGRDVTVKDAVIEAVKRGLNEGNVRTEICVWRKYHGIVRAKKA